MRDNKARWARKIVAQRFRAFFTALEGELAAGSQELWQRAEQKLREREGAVRAARGIRRDDAGPLRA